LPDYRNTEEQFRQALNFERRPVAISFRQSAPAGVAKFSGSEPSGCSFWRLAAAGRTFYTVPGDHYNCAIGSYTHNLALPDARTSELDQTLSFMTGIGYLKMEEVPAIPRLPRPPAVVIYAPLADAPLDPDVVLFAGRPGKLMLLQESAARVGVSAGIPMLGRPTCIVLPAALAGNFVVSSGCIGNRVYTGVGEDELYVAFPGKELEKIAGELSTIISANAKLAEFHQGRRKQLATE
jgi:uncharacterized protein (DUF169 family)